MTELKIDPFFLQSTKDVNQIIEPTLKKLNLNFFQYCSVYKDETSSFLVNNRDFAEKRVKQKRKILSHIDEHSLGNNKYFFFWNESLPIEDTNMARDLNIDNGLCFVERFQDHYNLIAFGTEVGKRFVVPTICQDENRFKILDLSYLSQTNEFIFNGIRISLSLREKQCLDFIAQGYSIKGIALKLDLSPRTVETYLNRLKSKMGVHYKDELVEFCSKKLI